MAPFRDLVRRSDTVFLKGEYYNEIESYLGNHSFHAFGYEILQNKPRGLSFEGFLQERTINLVYLDTRILDVLSHDPAAQQFLTAPDSVGWTVVAVQHGGDGEWRLLAKAGWNESPPS